jgi:hypothetical protein
MKNLIRIILLATFMTGGLCSAQSPSKAAEDFKPSSVNQPGKEYPQVNSEGRVRVQISAPEAKKVQLDIGAVKYEYRRCVCARSGEPLFLWRQPLGKRH